MSKCFKCGHDKHPGECVNEAPASPACSIADFGITCVADNGLDVYTKPWGSMCMTFNINDFTPDELEAVAAHMRERAEQ